MLAQWWQGEFRHLLGPEVCAEGFCPRAHQLSLTADSPFPLQIEDCHAALIHLRQHGVDYHLDPNRVGALGHSAGAHLAALMAVTGDSQRFSRDPGASVRVQAAVCWATPADLDRERGDWPETWMMDNGTMLLFGRFSPTRVMMRISRARQALLPMFIREVHP